MHIGMVGLGKMGGNLVRRLLNKGHRCVVYDQNLAAIQALVIQGAGVPKAWLIWCNNCPSPGPYG